MEVFQRGWVLAIPVLVMAVVAFVLGTVMQNQLAKILKIAVVGGLILVGCGLVLFCPCKKTLWFVVTATILGLGTGAVLPALNTLITSTAPKTERGLITCLYGTVRFFGVAVGPPLFGFAEKLSKPPIFFTTAAICVAIAILFVIFVKPEQIIPKDIQNSQG